MVFTHILVGILIGAFYSTVHPEAASIAVIAGLFGGGFPDVDMLFMHRKTLHYPVIFSLLSVAGAIAVVIAPLPVIVLFFIAMTAAAVHCMMDTLGGGKEMRPWEKTDDRAVFNHVSGEWITPRRLFYDGSIYDLAISLAASVLSWLLVPEGYRQIILLLLILATVYVALRRWITEKISDEFPTFSSYIQHRLSSFFS